MNSLVWWPQSGADKMIFFRIHFLHHLKCHSDEKKNTRSLSLSRIQNIFYSLKLLDFELELKWRQNFSLNIRCSMLFQNKNTFAFLSRSNWFSIRLF